MDFVVSTLLSLLCVGSLFVFLLALISPFETLNWWSTLASRPNVLEVEATPSPPEASEDANFIVYLTAIGGISAHDISGREKIFLEKLGKQVPNPVIIRDVFPFSVSNNPLNGERQFGWLWQRIHNSRLKGRPGVFAFLIFTRNLFQVAVSGDPRYGPLYNLGVAREILESLLAHGYAPGSRQPVYVMGWSGGGQIALGVARYLHGALKAPIIVISIGGVLSGTPGISDVAHLYHLQGSKDRIPGLSAILFPGRWPFLPYTPWNQARQEGRMTVIDLGPMHHTGAKDYFDRKATLENGQTFVDKTVSVITDIIEQSDPAPTAVS